MNTVPWLTCMVKYQPLLLLTATKLLPWRWRIQILSLRPLKINSHRNLKRTYFVFIYY